MRRGRIERPQRIGIDGGIRRGRVDIGKAAGNVPSKGAHVEDPNRIVSMLLFKPDVELVDVAVMIIERPNSAKNSCGITRARIGAEGQACSQSGEAVRAVQRGTYAKRVNEGLGSIEKPVDRAKADHPISAPKNARLWQLPREANSRCYSRIVRQHSSSVGNSVLASDDDFSGGKFEIGQLISGFGSRRKDVIANSQA